jgi:hypothetical protein
MNPLVCHVNDPELAYQFAHTWRRPSREGSIYRMICRQTLAWQTDTHEAIKRGATPNKWAGPRGVQAMRGSPHRDKALHSELLSRSDSDLEFDGLFAKARVSGGEPDHARLFRRPDPDRARASNQ